MLKLFGIGAICVLVWCGRVFCRFIHEVDQIQDQIDEERRSHQL